MAFDRDWLESEGFSGFVSFRTLRAGGTAVVPGAPGVYAVLREDAGPPSFLKLSVGGHFKGKNPTVTLDRLREKWIDACGLLYFGKATSLRTRITQFVNYGFGQPVGHQGGRYLWQLDAAHDLLLAWRRCAPDEVPVVVERAYLIAFAKVHGGRLPFANLV